MKVRTHKEALQELVSEADGRTYGRPARKRAVIIFTPRSGSSWLTDMLVNTGAFGNPHEYANQQLFHVSDAKARTEIDHLNAMECLYSTSNGVFSMEITFGDIERFETIDFLEYYKDAAFIHLRRRDIVAQAVSCFVATQTGVFHKNADGLVVLGDSTENNIHNLLDQSDAIPKIKNWCIHLLDYEFRTESQFLARGIKPLRIFYEDLIANAEATVAALFTFTGIEHRIANVSSSYEQVGSEINRRLGEQFKAEQSQFLKKLHRIRPPVRRQEGLD